MIEIKILDVDKKVMIEKPIIYEVKILKGKNSPESNRHN